MNLIIVIAIALAVLAVLAELLREVLADRPTHRPLSHFQDPDLRSPGAWG